MALEKTISTNKISKGKDADHLLLEGIALKEDKVLFGQIAKAMQGFYLYSQMVKEQEVSAANVDTTNNTLTPDGGVNRFKDNDTVVLDWTLGVDNPPNPLTSGTAYYVIESNPLNFKLSATRGGSAINLTTQGAGTIAYTSNVFGDITLISRAAINRESSIYTPTNYATLPEKARITKAYIEWFDGSVCESGSGSGSASSSASTPPDPNISMRVVSSEDILAATAASTLEANIITNGAPGGAGGYVIADSPAEILMTPSTQIETQLDLLVTVEYYQGFVCD